MRQLLILLLGFITVETVAAQRPQLPLPQTKNFRVLEPPDLIITNLNLVSITKHYTTTPTGLPNGTMFYLTLSVAIKNRGELISGAFKVQTEFKHNDRIGTWFAIPEMFPIDPLGPGLTSNKEFSFWISTFSLGYQSITMRVLADAVRVITEINENNNYSPSIVFTPPSK